MMDVSTSNNLSTLSFDVKIIRAKNIESKFAEGDLFVRCYLPAGNNKRVQLNTKQISSKSLLYWDETFSLECLGSQESVNSLRQGNVVLELRWWRKTTPFLGRIGGSKLLGRAAIPWKNVFDSPNMETETWVSMVPRKSSSWNNDLKRPKVQLSMRISMPQMTSKMALKDRLRRWEECGCPNGSCNSCVDYDFYAIGFALDAL